MRQKLRQDFEFKAMGCPCKISVCGDDPGTLDYVGKLALKECLRLDRKYSRFISTSLINKINAIAGSSTKLELDSETSAIIDFAYEAYSLSDGLFDISAGPLIRLWDHRIAKFPTPQQIVAQQQNVGLDNVIWDDGLLALPVPGMCIDLDGLVKEYAVDSMLQLIHRNGVNDVLINLGGDLRASGFDRSSQEKGWSVHIQNPEQRDHSLLSMTLLNGALATSGTLERGFEKNGQWFSHIINPVTAKPVTRTYSSLTVKHDSCMMAGVLATIALLKGKPAGDLWLTELGADFYINDLV